MNYRDFFSRSAPHDHDMKNPLRKRKKLKRVPFLSLLLSIFSDTTDGPASRFCHRSGFLLSENNKGTVLLDVIISCCAWFLQLPTPSFLFQWRLWVTKTGRNKKPMAICLKTGHKKGLPADGDKIGTKKVTRGRPERRNARSV